MKTLRSWSVRTPSSCQYRHLRSRFNHFFLSIFANLTCALEFHCDSHCFTVCPCAEVAQILDPPADQEQSVSLPLGGGASSLSGPHHPCSFAQETASCGSRAATSSPTLSSLFRAVSSSLKYLRILTKLAFLRACLTVEADLSGLFTPANHQHGPAVGWFNLLSVTFER